MPRCKRCRLDVEDLEGHTFYAWDVTHECLHRVVYRAVCDAYAFSSPQVGINTSAFLARIAGEPCPWCGGEVYGNSESVLKPPAGIEALRLTGTDLTAHLLAFRRTQ